MPSTDEFEDSSDYYSFESDGDDDGEDGGYNSGRGDRILNGVDEAEEDEDDDDDDDDGHGRQEAHGQAPASADSHEDEDQEDEEEVIQISSQTHGVPSGAMSQLDMLGAMAGRMGRHNLEIEVVSLARYTFADPELAAEGPQPLEPPVDQALMGVRELQLRGALPVGQYVGDARLGGSGHLYDHDGVIADFTEERNNQRLGRIARRLLLPDSYVEACYDLHEFMATEGAGLATESVQRNTFKCLKICARLSKLPGYSIQHMWQVIQKAYERVHEFTPPRANTIGLWHAKLSNRIRMMAVSPAADGSAPPRLPTVPPPELLDAHRREKLLPLPEVNATALNDARFNRKAGASGASYYLANPISRPSPQIMPPVSALVMPPPDTPADLALARLREPGSPTQPVVEEPDFLGLRTQETALGSDASVSTREAELAIIEHQLAELEQTPPHRMGPMLRAALNLLVELRFRLRLGLPRSSLAEENPLTAPRRIPVSGNADSEAAANEEQVIEYVLSRISTSRRNNALAQAAAAGHYAPLGLLPGAPPGMPMPPGPPPAARNAPYRDTMPRSELRRRRGSDGASSSEDTSDSDRLTALSPRTAYADDSDDSDSPMTSRREPTPARALSPRHRTEASRHSHRRRRQLRRPRLAQGDE